MRRVTTAVVATFALAVVTASHAKPTTPAPTPLPSSSKNQPAGDVFYAPRVFSSVAQPVVPTTQAAATLKCANKFTLVMANNNSAYCRRDYTDVRTVSLICPEGSVLMTEDKIPSSAKSFALNDLCYKTGAPPEAKSSYTFPKCDSDRTGSFPLTAKAGADVCEKRLAAFIAIPPGSPDTVRSQEGIATDQRINDAKVWCAAGTGDPMIQDGDGVYCKKK
ncbi:MAG: hypothetical protein U0174_25495 [Polyangiaceae bacterium]